MRKILHLSRNVPPVPVKQSQDKNITDYKGMPLFPQSHSITGIPKIIRSNSNGTTNKYFCRPYHSIPDRNIVKINFLSESMYFLSDQKAYPSISKAMPKVRYAPCRIFAINWPPFSNDPYLPPIFHCYSMFLIAPAVVLRWVHCCP